MLLCVGGSDPTATLRRERGGSAFLLGLHWSAGERSEQTGDALDQSLAGVEHDVRADRALRSDRLAQRIVGADHLDPRRLAMIPLHAIVDSVRTDDAVPSRDLGPELGFRAAGAANSVHVDGEAISVQRVELVRKTADAERGRPIGGKDPRLS